MKALVTGSHGFVGKHLVNELLAQGWEVKGFNLRDGQDLRDYEFVRNALDVERPDAIFHLAAQAAPAESFANPARTFEVNTIGTTNLLEAVRQLGLKCRVHLASTSEVYGPSAPFEDGPLEPRSPYAVSKVAMDYLGQLYTRAYGIHVVVTRAFNHTGPGRGEMYAEASFAKQIAEIESGRREFLEHGNLDSVRNYTDVRDVVKAYVLAIGLDPGVYNICSDQNVSMGEVIDMLCLQSTATIRTKFNVSLKRPADFSFIRPNCDKFAKLTGWKPERTLNDTLKDILEEWRAKV